jgi:hypothetical protein
MKIDREMKKINALASFGQNRISLLKWVDREFPICRQAGIPSEKKIYALNKPFARTVFFRSFLPRATLLRLFAMGYKYAAHTRLKPQILIASHIIPNTNLNQSKSILVDCR